MASLLATRLLEELEKDRKQGKIIWNELGSVNRTAYARRLGVTKNALPLAVFAPFDDLGPRKVSTEEKLRSMLHEDFLNGRVVFSKSGFISKLHYAQRAGCSNTQYYKELFEEYEAKLGELKTKHLLLGLLSRDFADGTLKFSRGGKIDRTHYATQLGVTKSALTSYIPVFTSFEEKLGGAKRYRDDDLRRMEKWLEAHLADGTLRVRRGGGVARAQFKSAFGITHSDFEIRFPEIGVLLKKYDILVDQCEAARRDEAVRARAKEQAAGNKIASRIPEPDPAEAPLFENAGIRTKADGFSRGPVVRPEDEEVHPSADIEKEKHADDGRRPATEIKPTDDDTVFALIDAAVAADLGRGKLRLLSDGSIDRSFYLAQALVAVSGIAENVFARYAQQVEAYRERHGTGIAAIADAMSPHSVADSAVAEDIDGCSDVAEGRRDVAVLNMNDRSEDRVAGNGWPGDFSQVIQDKKGGTGGGEDVPDGSSGDWLGPLLVFFPQLKRHQEYPPDSPLGRAVSILNEMILGPGLPRTAYGGLNRSEVQNILRIGRSELPTYDHILIDYDIATRFVSNDRFSNEERSNNPPPPHPSLVRHQNHNPSSAFGRAVAVLNAMVSGDGLPRASDGTLDEIALARGLGINHRALGSYRHIVHDYEVVDRAVNTTAPTIPKEDKPASKAGAAAAADGTPVGNDLSKSTLGCDEIESAPTSVATNDNVTSADASLRLNGQVAERLTGGIPEKVDVTPVAEQQANSGNPRLSEHPCLRKHQPAETILSPAAAEVVSNYPMLEKHQYYGLDNTRGRLVDILNSYLVSGGIPRSRGGKIDRRGLTRKFGFSITAMTHYVDILHDYEEATGGRQNIHEAKIPEMEAWLIQSMEDGTLETRDGGVERRSFYRRFNMSDTNAVLVRNPRVLALIEKYDRLIVSSGYLSKPIRAEVDLLVATLDDNPEIAKTGLSYDRTALSSRTGISMGRIVRSPFKEVINAADKKLRAQVDADELCHVFAGRLFSFRTLQDLGWSRQFLVRVGRAFRQGFQTEGQSAAKDAYNSLMEMLRFFGSSQEPSCRAVKTGLSAGGVRSVAAADWTFATQLYASWVNENPELRGSTPDTKLKSATKVIRRLSNYGTLPELDLPLRGKGEQSEHRRTIAQGPRAEGVDDYLVFATAMLHEAARLREIDIDPNDEAGFLKTLRKELTEGKVKPDDTPAAIILRVLKRRMTLIDDAFAEVYIRWRRHWDRGRELLAIGEELGDGWEELLVAGSHNEHRRRLDMRRYFPLDEPDRALANLVRLIADRFGGLYPKDEVTFGKFFVKRALEFGGKPHIEGYVTPHSDAVGAAVILFLARSGANVAVGRPFSLARWSLPRSPAACILPARRHGLAESRYMPIWTNGLMPSRP
ncbi:hypothetical protein FHT70_002616 [Rhizobium sp. BK049]|uniref:hypothetical protein n=1 Tax=Rhizobium sp. BK049 TaxID=2587095 RepID=UPI00161B7EB6|nr:hypothetical protein [Rhizobium sp. BK049]MBB3352683.1 hypothetical protein [Rhizobium sp. BK049]